MSIPLIVCKLGGSVLTRKRDGLPELDRPALRRIAGELRRALAERALRLVLIHGVGAYGHSLVAETGIAEGLRLPEDLPAFLRAHLSVAGLNLRLAEFFHEAGLPILPLSPAALFELDRKAIVTAHLAPIEFALETLAAIPLLHGDMVPDRTLGGAVLSGDLILAYLSRVLRADLALLGTDVDGVFDRDPRLDPTARLLERLPDPQNPAADVSGSTATDVTGGMGGKLAALARELSGIPAWIFNLEAPDRLFRLLTGRSCPGTRIG
ncbi:MAG: hypothetical protein A2284_18185 [Deltaproteobacteria bacterium RIFOXYA12_FULL_61_11]|nr:MAG: hypothetical protein A2284_18185 [Deltaproteobacteria bacterium RIFOXYA12_FULL_61_11]